MKALRSHHVSEAAQGVGLLPEVDVVGVERHDAGLFGHQAQIDVLKPAAGKTIPSIRTTCRYNMQNKQLSISYFYHIVRVK